MIKIDLPASVPEGLHGGSLLVQQYCAQHDAAPELYATREGKFVFDNSMYGCETVRSALKSAQFLKCCYCESKIAHIGAGEVEHFRPKAAWQQKKKTPLSRPAYHWLAYSWNNLLWSCKTCNGSYKKNLFPLADPDARDCLGRDLTSEQPLLINPASIDPRRHIRFELEVAKAQTEEGERTIELLGLNRDNLSDMRRGVRDRLIAEWLCIGQAERLGEEEMEKPAIIRAKRNLADAVLPRSAYSSMAIDLISELNENGSLINNCGPAK